MMLFMQLYRKYITAILFVLFLKCTIFLNVSQAQITVSPVVQHSDQWLEGKLQGILDCNDYLNSADVDVLVKGEVITLRGVVPSNEERDFTVKVVQKIGGTLKVVDQIRVDGRLTKRNRNDLEQYVADQAIEAKVKILLAAFKLTNNADIKVEVKNSVVYLKGSTLFNDVKIKAGRVASLVYGVREVKNLISIRELDEDGNQETEPVNQEEFTANDGWISDKIRSLLHYNASFSGSDVLVATRDGNVELKGRVKNANQKTELINEVRDILGVVNITSTLEVLD